MPKGQDLTQLKARKQELMDKEEFWGGMIRGGPGFANYRVKGRAQEDW
jgi:hypothetical protein